MLLDELLLLLVELDELDELVLVLEELLSELVELDELLTLEVLEELELTEEVLEELLVLVLELDTELLVDELPELEPEASSSAASRISPDSNSRSSLAKKLSTVGLPSLPSAWRSIRMAWSRPAGTSTLTSLTVGARFWS